MRRRPDNRAAALAIAALAVVGFGCGGSDQAKVAAVVEGQEISAKTTDKLIASFLESDAVREEVEDGDLNPRVAGKYIVEYLIRITYLDHIAKELGVVVPENEQEVQSVKALGPEAFASRGWSSGDFRRALRAGRLSKALAEKLFPAVSIPEDELEKYYEANASRLKNYWHAVARVAFFDREEPAGKLRERVAAGEQFDEAAGALGAEMAGSLGELTPDARLGKPLMDAISSLPTGHVGDPLGIGGGWFVVMVDRRIDTPAHTFADVKAEIASRLQDVRRQELFEIWLKKQLTRADVKVNDKYGQWEPVSGEVA